ncbi:MAG: hypothetical protein COW67_14060 [Flavobacteriales bacterium CG18_big_fil_WC_8_21_14_2_50_32_9]|nr:MAG: hypothetical protein COW67_14060 [Flavobacteriales bacterium CG18_big_fil_WC_8_21_14_2_50_32_9]
MLEQIFFLHLSIIKNQMKNIFTNISFDKWIVLILFFISVYTVFNLKHWKKENRVIVSDVVDYYGYLPATFIYGDVTLTNPTNKITTYSPTFWYHTTPEGKKVFKTSMGMALIYAPFFFVAHLFATSTDAIADGFSTPYKFAICMSSLFYFLIGLIFLRKTLRLFFSTNVTAITLILIGLGTNLFYYTVIAIGMPHTYLFCLVAILTFLILKFYEKPTLINSIFIGFLSGLVVLIRPSMLVFALFASLVNISSIVDLKNRISFYSSNFKFLFILLLMALIVWLPQFYYWKIASGSFLFYSYTDEGFYFNDPQLFNSLFSFRKGWLIYTPLMVFSIVGLIMTIKNKLSLAILITVGSYIYINSSWWCWWFGGSFGQRPMIDLYPILAIGLAYFIDFISTKHKIVKTSFFMLLFLLAGFNLFQTRQAHEGILHHDSMTKEAYFKIAFKLQKQISRDEVAPYLNPPDYEAAKKGNRNQ